jgi:hypothetical protein
MLFGISVVVEDEYQGGEEFTVWDFFSNDLIDEKDLLYQDALLHYAHCAVVALRGEDRVKKLLEVEQMARYGLTLDDIRRVGKDIPAKEVFLDEWIACLTQAGNPSYEPLIIDALKCKGDLPALEEYVLEFGVSCQSAYLDLIKEYRKAGNTDKAVEIIEHGLSHISGVNDNRVKMADMLAEVGTQRKDPELCKKGVTEGFFSSIDLSHFAALRELQDQLLTAKAIVWADSNKAIAKGLDYMHFLNGEFGFVWQEISWDKTYLGWSHGNRKAKSFPLFVALLAGSLKPCVKKLLEQYSTSYSSNDFQVLAKALPSVLRPLTDDERTKYWDWCDRETRGRVKGIVGEQHRGSYFKASLQVVAMAEALREIKGEAEAKRYIQSFKLAYPRHTNFHGCLRIDLATAGMHMEL